MSRAEAQQAPLRRTIAARGTDGGISLIELLVTMVLVGILSAIVVGVFVNSSSSVTRGSAATINTSTAANVMNETSRVIRSGATNPVAGGTDAPAFVTAKAEQLVLYSYVDVTAVSPQPVKVEFAVDPATRLLVEKRWSAKAGATGLWIFDGTNPLTSTRTMPGKITAPAAPATVFSYLDSTGALLTIPGSGFTAAQLATIASVKVTLVVQAAEGASAKPVTLVNSIRLPNLSFKAGP
ncbi:type II secretion system protein [Glaciibacter psychrotolerans]|uniref:Type II secretory pathway pseudopilin PulG n=1 Tax=Glaciibacter psychrotolerans TaxID=670054 RepID=A0A7Z0EH24_9MICO|nr:type II secretion system protein [Leifsonia psychrotolerans]NYJ21536.1 type II secretory pathway pseudopilin PulG [Leifsonia psychrotolerans]